MGVDLQRPFDGVLHGAGIKEVVHVVVICRRGDDDELGGAVGRRLVRGGAEVQRPLSLPGLPEKALDLIVLDGAEKGVQLVRLGLGGGDGRDLMLLGQQDGQAQPHIPHTGNRDLHIPFLSLLRL